MQEYHISPRRVLNAHECNKQNEYEKFVNFMKYRKKKRPTSHSGIPTK